MESTKEDFERAGAEMEGNSHRAKLRGKNPPPSATALISSGNSIREDRREDRVSIFNFLKAPMLK